LTIFAKKESKKMSRGWENLTGLFASHVPRIMKSMEYENKTKQDLHIKNNKLRAQIKRITEVQEYKYQLIRKAVYKAFLSILNTPEFNDRQRNRLAIQYAYYYLYGLYQHTQDISMHIPRGVSSDIVYERDYYESKGFKEDNIKKLYNKPIKLPT